MNEKRHGPVKVYFDGGCRPNPGPVETAVVLRGVAHIRRDQGDGDSEQAEWLALFHALEIAASHGERDIILIGDSLPVIRQAVGTLRCAPSRAARFGEAAQSFDRVRLRYSGRSQNLAGIALERARWKKDGI